MRVFFRDGRGVAMLDMVVGCALIATFAVAFAAIFGQRPAHAHSAATSLEMALSEARSLAAANANALDPAYPTGATVVVEADPDVSNASRIAVYRSRPVVIGARIPSAPPRDAGFPAERVAARFQFTGTRLTATKAKVAQTITEPFAIMLSGGGYASIVQLTAPYDEAKPALYTSDPGCPAEGAQIVTIDGDATEAHPFGCSGGAFHAS